jgi:Tol biopolymer transport system component
MKLALALLGVALATQSVSAKGLTIEDMLAMQRVADPQVSPDGKQIAFSVRETDMAANKGRYDIWLIGSDGSNARRLTSNAENDTDPRWSADGKYVYFASTRSGSAQVWRIAVAGGEAEQVTKLPLDINGFTLFPDGKRLVVAIDVYPNAKTLADTVKQDEAKEKSKVKAQAYDNLLFRHWDQWEDGKFSHVFVWDPAKPDDARDLTPGQETDSPTHPMGGMEEIDVSPDGKTVAYVARVAGKQNAWQTNTDVFLVAADGKSKAVDVTSANPAYDFTPTFSPDGKWLATASMKRAGYEGDRSRLTVIEVATRKPRVVTEAWDHSVGDITWSADGKTIVTTSDNVGHHSVFAIDVATGTAKVIVEKGTNTTPRIAGDRIVFSKDTLTMPAELFSVKADGSELC